MAKTTIPGMHSESTPMDFFGFLEKYGKKYTGADIAFNLDPSKPLSEQARYTRGSVFEAMQLTLTGEISGDIYFQEKIIPRLLDNDSELTSLILDDKFKYDFAGKHRGTPFLADPSAFYKEGLERKLEARELHRARGTKRPIDRFTGKHPLMPDDTMTLVSRPRDDGKGLYLDRAGGKTRDFVKGRKDKILRGDMSRIADRVPVPALTEIGDLKTRRGKWTGWNEAGWFNLRRKGTKGDWEGLVNVAESHVISHPTKGSLKAHGVIRPKIYFGIDDQTKVAGAIPRITDYLDEKFGDNPAFSFKVEERLKKTSVPHALTSDFIVMHAASQEGTEKSVLEQTQKDIAKILQEEGAGSLSTELGFDYGLYGLDESGNPLLQNKIIGGSYTNILDMQLEMATRDSKDSPFTKDVIEQLRGVDPESELGKDLARLGILDDLGVTPATTPQGREAVRGAVDKLLDTESPPRSRGTILVDIDSTLLDNLGDELWSSLREEGPKTRRKKYLAKMLSDSKYSKLEANKPLISKLRKLKDQNYDIRLWTNRDPGLEEVTRNNLEMHGLLIGEEDSLFSELIMGGPEGGDKLHRIPGDVVAVIDDSYANLESILEESVDVNLTGREKLGTVARINRKAMESDNRLSKILLGGKAEVATSAQMEELRTRSDYGLTKKKPTKKKPTKKVAKKVSKSSAETRRSKIIKELQKTWQDGPYDSPVTRDLLDQLSQVDPETAEFIEGTFDLTKQFEDWSEGAEDSPQVSALREKFQDLDKKAYDQLDREVESGVEKKLPREELDARVRESVKEQLEIKASAKKVIKKTTKKVAKKVAKKTTKKKTTKKKTRRVTGAPSVTEAPSDAARAIPGRSPVMPRAADAAEATVGSASRRGRSSARPSGRGRSRRGRSSARPRRNSSAGTISFWFDVEATDIGFSHQDKVIKDGELIKIHRGEGIPTRLPFSRLGPKETAPVQITQMYGQIYGRGVGSRLPKEYSRYMHLDLPPDIDPRNIDIEFQYPKKAGKPNITNSEIERIMKKDPHDNYLSRGRGDITARKAMLLDKGVFTVKDKTVLGRITASGRSNPTAGNFGLGVKLVGSTLNTVLGKNVFMSKYGHEDMISSQKFVSEFMTTMSDLSKEAKRRNIRAEVVGWNVGYDITKVAENIDLYGKDLDIEGVPVREVFKRLFIGTTGSHAEQTIRIVDAQDKVKDIQFWKLVHDDNYNLQNINHKEVQYLLRTGQQSRDQIKQNVYRQLKDTNTGRGPRRKLIQNNTAMKELAGHVSTQKRTPQSKDAIESILLRKLDRGASHGSFDWTSDEGKVVSTSANMIRELAEVDHASGLSSTEVLRRNVQSLRNIHGAQEMLSKMFRHTQGTGGIMGFDNAKDIRFTERNGLTRGMLEQMGTYATGSDIGGGNSLTGGGGVVESLIWAKGDYLLTHNVRRNAPLGELFHDIDQLQKQNFSASAHEASTDVKQMMASVMNIFDRHMINPRPGEHTEMNEFAGLFMEQQKRNSAARAIDSYHNSEIIDDAIMGGEIDTRPAQQTIEAAGDTASEVAGSLADEVRGEGVPSVAKSIKRRQRGVLGVAAFTLAGLALIGNRNGGIKHPGTDYNSIEGMSPSGDPLLHSFGSGNDSFQSEALSNITYGTHYGSDTIRASALGYRGDRLRNMLLGISSFDDYTRSSEKGTLIHSIIETEYLKSGIAQASEHTVHSSELDVMGHIDLVLKSGVPLEIKTVADYDALENLKSPREAHISQANFYAYALKQPYALIGYAARNDPKKVKYFKVNTNINRIMKDVKEVRSMMSTLRAQGHSVQNYSAYQMMKDVQARARQDKYKENAVNSGMGMPPGMLASPENYGGYSGIASFGDYKRWIKKALWRQENKSHITQFNQFKSKSRIRNQGKHAALHSNNNVRYSKAATHVNKSRQVVPVNYNWPKATHVRHRVEVIFSG